MAEVKPIVLVVHGMGSFGEGDFKKAFVDSANTALNKYQNFKSKKIEDLVQVEEFNFDKFFQEMRQKMSDRNEAISKRLSQIGELNGLDWGAELVLKLANLEAKFGEDEFLYTHLLDVYFYMTLLGEKVRIDFADKLSGLIKDNPEAAIHIVAHSLGTAVVHDSLAKLYTTGYDANIPEPKLSVTNHKLRSIWFFANVSKLVNTIPQIADPLKSVVKPTSDGCTTYFYNVRHELDPFCWPARFDPKEDGSWIPAEYYNNAYLQMSTSVIREPNTHSFGEYIENARVAPVLFRRLLGNDFKPNNIDKVSEDYEASDIPGAFDAMNEALEDFSVSDAGSFKEFVQAALHFQRIVKDFKAQIDALKDGGNGQ